MFVGFYLQREPGCGSGSGSASDLQSSPVQTWLMDSNETKYEQWQLTSVQVQIYRSLQDLFMLFYVPHENRMLRMKN